MVADLSVILSTGGVRMLHNPFFWAFVSLLGMVMATSIFSGHRLVRRRLFIPVTLLLVTAGRVVMVLPFCIQPRLPVHPAVPAGIALFSLGLLVGAVPFFTVRWWAPPEKGMRLRTSGIYRLTRNPIYLSEVLWFTGWALLFRSLYGLLLVPVWWFVFLIHALAEEADMLDTLGDGYREYMKRVRGRIFPGLPF